MTHPQVAIFGYSEAAMFLRGTPSPDLTGIISIHGARELGVDANLSNRLDLTFDDVEIVPARDVLSFQRAVNRKRWAEQNNLIEVAPASSDAASIIKFADNVRDVGGILLCHCGGGMSRAPAAALICLAVWQGPGAEADCVVEVLNLRKGAMPHIGLMQFADDLLHREGKLVGAVAAARR